MHFRDDSHANCVSDTGIQGRWEMRSKLDRETRSGARALRLSSVFAVAVAMLVIAPFAGAATTFGPRQIITTAADGAQTVFSIDIDGDGDNDAVSAALQGGEIAWYENDNGDGSSWSKRVILSVALGRAAHAVDVNGDGDIDVVSAAGDVIRWHENDGLSPPGWTSHTIASNVFSASDVWAGDIDGDGDIDVVSASVNSDRVYWHENVAGDGSSWSIHTVTSNVDAPQSVDGADVDGDGDFDILAVAGGNTTNKVSWFENGNAWAEDQISSFMPGFLPQLSSVHAVDIDGDSDIDALACGRSPFGDQGRIWLWRNTAASGNPPSWSSLTIDFAQGDAVFAADLDGDGDQDVMKTHRTNDDVSWYENLNGLGTSWSKTTIGTADGGRDVFAADVDGDGDFDILAASSTDDTVAWFENAPVATTSADLSVSKTATPNPVAPGGALTFDITATNLGPDDATGVTVVDTLPTGVAFVSASTGCSEVGGIVTCTVGGLAASASVPLQIVVTAPAVAGTVTNSVLVSATEDDPVPSNNVATVDVDVVANVPVVSVTPSPVDFGDQIVNTRSAELTVTLTNSGTAPLVWSSITITGDFSMPAPSMNCSSPLAAGGSCTFGLDFLPTAIGTRSGTLTITSNAPTSPDNVPVTGNGIPGTPDLVVTPSSVDFGSQLVGATSTPVTVTLLNRGTADVNLSGISISGDFSQTNDCGATLTPAHSCQVNVVFSPSVLGPLTGDLTVESDAPSSPDVVPLSGNGIEQLQAIPDLSPWGRVVLIGLLAMIGVGLVQRWT